jgi:hypothetical protein
MGADPASEETGVPFMVPSGFANGSWPPRGSKDNFRLADDPPINRQSQFVFAIGDHRSKSCTHRKGARIE